MISFLYEVIYFLLFLAYLPYAIYQALCKKKYRKSFLQRFTYGFPRIEKQPGQPLIWVHAVSVGETQAVSQLIAQLKHQMDARVIVSSITETGHEEAKRTIKCADFHVFMPFDFYWTIKRALSRITPDIIIISETDFWLRFQNEAKKRGAVIAVVNAKISQRSFIRFSKVRFFTKQIFSSLDACCVQTQEYALMFSKLGVENSKIFVTGNLKCDIPLTKISAGEVNDLRQKLQFSDQDKIIVVGSTHDPEEKLLIDELLPLIQSNRHIKVCLVPRHPERFSQVADLLSLNQIPYSRWSDTTHTFPTSQVILVDAMGVLRKCYQIADIAIVAGSFTERVGGHNILEPQGYGVPVICGPYMHSQPYLIQTAKAYDAVIQIPITDLKATVMSLLEDEERYLRYSENARKMMQEIVGASAKTIAVIEKIVPQYFHER